MKQSKFCYVSGPYTSAPGANTRRAILVAHRLLKKGYTPVVPHLNLLFEFVCPGMTYDDYLGWDIGLLSRCDLLVRIPGKSKGSDIEVKYALEHGIPVYSPRELGV